MNNQLHHKFFHICHFLSKIPMDNYYLHLVLVIQYILLFQNHILLYKYHILLFRLNSMHHNFHHNNLIFLLHFAFHMNLIKYYNNSLFCILNMYFLHNAHNQVFHNNNHYYNYNNQFYIIHIYVNRQVQSNIKHNLYHYMDKYHLLI